jgi:hypothetical protein
MGNVRISDLAADYIRARKEAGEHTSLDSAIREVFHESDEDWQEVVREYRSEDDDPEGN